MFRKFWLLTAAILSIFTFITPMKQAKAAANFDTPICLTVNDTYLAMDSEPFLYAGSTFVPIRFVSSALGADEVWWDAGKKTAVIRDGGTTIRLPIGKKVAYINGSRVSVDKSVMLVNDRTYVPVRFVAEHLGCTVSWDSASYTVLIQKKGSVVPEALRTEPKYDKDEIYWLSKIIHAESQGEPMEGKIAVGNVILNRVESPEFPSTIYSVIFDRNYGVQFSPTLDGSIYQTPLGDSVIAAKRALRGEKTVGKSLYFLNPKTAESPWIINNRKYYKTIANHDFYL